MDYYKLSRSLLLMTFAFSSQIVQGEVCYPPQEAPTLHVSEWNEEEVSENQQKTEVTNVQDVTVNINVPYDVQGNSSQLNDLQTILEQLPCLHLENSQVKIDNLTIHLHMYPSESELQAENALPPTPTTTPCTPSVCEVAYAPPSFGWRWENCSYNFYGGLIGGFKDFFTLPSFSFGRITPEFVNLSDLGAIRRDDNSTHSAFAQASLGWCASPGTIPYWLGINPRVELSAELFSSSKLDSRKRTIGSAIVLYMPSIALPSSTEVGQADLNPGDLFLNNFKRSWQNVDLSLRFTSNFPLALPLFPISLEPIFSIKGAWLNQKLGLDLAQNSSGTFSKLTTIDESLDSLYLDVGGGAKIELALPNHFSFFFGGILYTSYAHTAFSGSQEFSSSISHITNQKPTIKEIKHTFSSKAEAEAGILYHGQKLDIGLVANYEYWNYCPGVQNPVVIITTGPTATGARPAYIKESICASYSIALSLSMPF